MKLLPQAQQGLRGTLKVPGDKSISHRGLILGAISTGITHLHNFLLSQDCLSTLKALQALGIPISINEQTVTIHGRGLQGLQSPHQNLNMGNSGTTTRLLTGLLSGQHLTATLI
ncbi:3-phosphoshikimate 1-carboxyvinyltransferase, partial [Methylobacterium sp. W2]|nr:3-phosphoshikimate 1-carboxyvinyltransferase [Methylobacterium sp. W2]